jgi:hypothetical protein
LSTTDVNSLIKTSIKLLLELRLAILVVKSPRIMNHDGDTLRGVKRRVVVHRSGKFQDKKHWQAYIETRKRRREKKKEKLFKRQR